MLINILFGSFANDLRDGLNSKAGPGVGRVGMWLGESWSSGGRENCSVKTAIEKENGEKNNGVF